jgi:hypothetical protein
MQTERGRFGFGDQDADDRGFVWPRPSGRGANGRAREIRRAQSRRARDDKWGRLPSLGSTDPERLGVKPPNTRAEWPKPRSLPGKFADGQRGRNSSTPAHIDPFSPILAASPRKPTRGPKAILRLHLRWTSLTRIGRRSKLGRSDIEEPIGWAVKPGARKLHAAAYR